MQLTINFPKHIDPDLQKIKLTTHICKSIEKFMSLPEYLTIEFLEMYPNTYGETSLDHKSMKKVRLNIDLSVNDLLIPLVHELIHVNQMHTGKLLMSHSGVYVWENTTYLYQSTILPYKDYKQLPWEVDVDNRQPEILEQLFNL
jgi:hypothetical protein|tara:strand:- start:1260 stop:1691 length:432 start_codon:yes stop_codon:yes gene_type:complete